jgi:hypothetical protein
LSADPLGYLEARREQFPRDDLIKLTRDDCKDLISMSHKICYNLAIKDSRTCDVRELIRKMDVLPELVVDLQSSSVRGVDQMDLAMCLAHAPDLNIDEATTDIPKDASRINFWMHAVVTTPEPPGAYAMTSSTTRSFFPVMNPLKRHFRRCLKRKKDLPDPGMEATTHGPDPRRRRRTRPRATAMLLHLRQWMWRNEKLFLRGKNK